MSQRSGQTYKKYPFKNIPTHKYMQRRIDHDWARSLRVPSQATSSKYRSNSALIKEVDAALEEDRPTKTPDLLPNGMLDSDDERENDVAGRIYKKKRPGRHCCDGVKSIDMYGVQPTLKINGRSKFHTWWGAFFTVLALGAIGYYAYYKGLYYYFNKETYLVTNLILQN